MPPSRTTSTSSKRKPPAFKPPRPQPKSKPSDPSPSTTTTSTSRRKSASNARPSPSPPATVPLDSDSDSDANEPAAAPAAAARPSSPPPSTTIPPALLTKLLHTHFTNNDNGGMRISKDANAAVGKYMETFIREAIARAAFERAEAVAKGGVDGGRGGGDGFLEVEDLEKLAPQLLLDF